MLPNVTPHPCDIYAELRWLYDQLNRQLFQAQLPPCMLVLRQKPRAYGYFQAECWGTMGASEGVIDTIALNTALFTGRTEAEIVSTLAHEMVHLWQERYGEHVPATAYHNTEWAQKMIEIGLMPSVTGQPGGKKTGKNVSHYILETQPFIRTYTALRAQKEPLLSWQELPKRKPERQQEKKLKHECAPCGVKAWAVQDTPLRCGACGAAMVCPSAQLLLIGGEAL